MPMEIRNYVSSMGAWYGFMPRLAPCIRPYRQHFVDWMNSKGLQMSIPKSRPIPDYQLFQPDQFKIGKFTKHPVGNYPNSQNYYQSIVSIPTYTFEEYDLINRYIDAIDKYRREFFADKR